MAALNIRDIGTDRKATLDAEARAQGVSVAELVRRMLDDGIERLRATRARDEWLRTATAGLAFEAEQTDRNGPSLARYRTLPGRAG